MSLIQKRYNLDEDRFAKFLAQKTDLEVLALFACNSFKIARKLSETFPHIFFIGIEGEIQPEAARLFCSGTFASSCGDLEKCFWDGLTKLECCGDFEMEDQATKIHLYRGGILMKQPTMNTQYISPEASPTVCEANLYDDEMKKRLKDCGVFDEFLTKTTPQDSKFYVAPHRLVHFQKWDHNGRDLCKFAFLI